MVNTVDTVIKEDTMEVPETQTEFKNEDKTEYISVDIRLLQAIVDYLSKQPYKEVSHLLSSFKKS